MQEFFAEVHQLQGRPENATQKRLLLNKSQSLANEINSIATNLQRLRTATRQQIDLEVEAVNGQLEALARLNRRITQAQSAGQQP